jgi:hypothetical protein
MTNTPKNPMSLFVCSVHATVKLFLNENNWTTNMLVRKNFIEATLPKHLVKLVWRKSDHFVMYWFDHNTFPQVTDEYCKCVLCEDNININDSLEETLKDMLRLFWRFWMPGGEANLKNPIGHYKQQWEKKDLNKCFNYNGQD